MEVLAEVITALFFPNFFSVSILIIVEVLAEAMIVDAGASTGMSFNPYYSGSPCGSLKK